MELLPAAGSVIGGALSKTPAGEKLVKRGDETLKEIAARYDIHPTPARAWVGRRLIFLSCHGDKQQDRDAGSGIAQERQ